MHGTVGLLEFQFPVDKLTVDLNPVIGREGVIYLHAQTSETLLVVAVSLGGYDVTFVDVLFERQEYLVGMDGFDQVVGNLGADGLVHDVLLLTLGYHHNRDVGINLLDVLQGLKSAHAHHVLIQKYQVILALVTHVQRIVSVGDSIHLISLVLKEHDVCSEQVNLIVNPQECSVLILRLLHRR